jgi:hypothetical protein
MTFRLGIAGIVAIAALTGCDQTVTETLPDGRVVQRQQSGLATTAGYARATNMISGDVAGTAGNTADTVGAIADTYRTINNFSRLTRY